MVENSSLIATQKNRASIRPLELQICSVEVSAVLGFENCYRLRTILCFYKGKNPILRRIATGRVIFYQNALGGPRYLRRNHEGRRVITQRRRGISVFCPSPLT